MNKLFILFLLCFFSMDSMSVTVSGWSGICTSSCTVSGAGGAVPYVYTVTTFYDPGQEGTNKCLTVNASTGVLAEGDRWPTCRYTNGLVTDDADATVTFRIKRVRVMTENPNVFVEGMTFETP